MSHHILKSSWTRVCSQIIKYPEEPASRVELLQVSPVEPGGVVHLPVWKNLRHVRGPLQRVVSHQERHSVLAKEEGRGGSYNSEHNTP